MPLRPTSPAGAPCWIDLQCSDPDRAQEFYTALFGWTAAEASAEFGGYVMFHRDGIPVAGCVRADDQAPVSDIWSVYLCVADAEKTLESVPAHGGQVIVPAMPVGDTGTMAFVVDASGAAVGLWQPNQFPGFTVLAEPGAPSWFELVTRDFAAATAFYRDVFGWSMHVVSDTPALRYHALTAPGSDDWLAGLMDGATTLPDGAPSRWSVYVGVDDTHAALARTVDLGGVVVRPAEDTPYGLIAEIADPLGARLKIVAANEAMPARP